MDSVRMVQSRSLELLAEMMSGREISLGTKAKMIAKSVWGEFDQGLDRTLVWLGRLDAISRLVGS